MMRFSIGEFSRMTSLSIKSLRLYHDKGILAPAEVDAFTGYRYYDESNYETARAVRILRQYDFTLSEIKSVLDEIDDESGLLEQLVRKKGEIREKIDRYEAVCRSMETMIQFEKERAVKAQVEFTIEEKEIETLLIAGLRMKGKYQDIGQAFSKLAKSIGRHINGKAMTLYYDCEFKEDGADFEVAFPVRKGRAVPGISGRELPGGKAVTLIHKGPYDTLGDSYKKLFSYIHKKGYKTALPSREIYIKGPGMIFKGNPEYFLTEIAVMLNG
jgi:DNA-binding transcriptional MerR regulator